MNKKEQKKGGRPPRYNGEESVRIGAIMRPRYREVIGLLASVRGNTSFSEALEFVIAKFTAEYFVDGKPILDYIRPAEEPIKMLIDSLNYDKENLGNHKEKIQYINEYSKLPKSSHSPMSNYIIEILKKGSIKFFDFEKLIETLQEFWKQGIPTEKVLDYIENIFEFVKKNPEYINYPSERIIILFAGEDLDFSLL